MWVLLAGAMAAPGCGAETANGDGGPSNAGPTTCVEGASAPCTCVTGESGAQECRDDGTFAPCICEGANTLPQDPVDDPDPVDPVEPFEPVDTSDPSSDHPEEGSPEVLLLSMDLGGDTSDLDPLPPGTGGTSGSLACLQYPIAGMSDCPGTGCAHSVCWSGVCGVTQTNHQPTQSIDLACYAGEPLLNPFPVQAKVIAPLITRYSTGFCYPRADAYNAACSGDPAETEPCNNILTLQATVGGMTWKASLLHIRDTELAIGDVVAPFQTVAGCGHVGWVCPATGSHLHLSVQSTSNTPAWHYPGDLLSTQCDVITNDNTCSTGSTCCGLDGLYVSPGQQGAGCSEDCQACNGGGGCLNTCSETCPHGDGDYCGGPVGLDPSVLYTCSGGTFAVKESCPGGCQVAPAGSPDACKYVPTVCPEGDGTYCGDALGMTSTWLYACADGVITALEACQGGCQDGAGATDACQIPATEDTCPDGNGLYCGSALGLSPDKLYNCQNGTNLVVQVCGEDGCVVAPPGQADYCAEPVLGSCPSGNGLYCGATLGLSANKLYSCQDGDSSVMEDCADGCVIAPAGQADYCAEAPAASCPSGNGLYCGSTLGLSENKLYNCQNGNTTVAEDCSNGCVIAPPGQADYCAAAGTCPFGNGLYCGATLGKSANKLYDCQNGSSTVAEDCPNACVIAPPGQADYCT